MYKDIAKNLEPFELGLPNTIVPSPTKQDYELGFIRRYFVRKVNDENGFIFEVNDSEEQKYADNPFYKTVNIKWRISGPIEPTYKSNGEVDDKGVKFSNKAAIGLATTKFKNIGLYLPNILQFHK